MTPSTIRSSLGGRATVALGAAAMTLAGVLAGTGVADASPDPYGGGGGPTPPSQATLSLGPSNAALAACFPHATAAITVDLTTDAIGKDTFRVKARGLKPNTSFTVFLIQQAGPPFGAAEYIGDFTTNGYGRSSATFKLIVEEAFAFDNSTGARTDLNSVGVWFADPADDDECLGPNSPVTGFDGDASAGVQMLNSGADLLP